MTTKSKILLLVMLLMIRLQAFTTQQQIQQEYSNTVDDCYYPRILQYITDYSLPTDDLSYFIQNNMSQFELANMGKPRGTSFENISAIISYAGQDKQVTNSGQFRWQISQDGFKLSISLKAKIYSLTGSHIYDVIIGSDKIPVSYIKSYNTSVQSYRIQNTVLKIDENTLKIKSMKPEKESDKQKINALIKQQLVPAVLKNFAQLNSELNSNAKMQTVSEIYPDPTYNYKFYNLPLPVNMKTTNLEVAPLSYTVINGMAGQLIGLKNQYCPTHVHLPRKGFSQFFTLQFIRNLAEAGADKFQDWKNVTINRSNIRTQSFQFKLVDLQFIFDSAIWNAYGKYYMSQIYFTCSLEKLQSLYMTKNDSFLHALVQWNCKGFIDNAQNHEQDIIILDSDIKMDHQIIIYPQGGSVSAYSDKLFIVNVKFNDVQNCKVIDENLAKNYMQEMLFQFRTYVFGTYFKVKSSFSKVAYEVNEQEGDGIWFG